MNRPRFILSPEAVADLDEIWLFIAKDNMDAADRNEEELRAAMVLLARQPNVGHVRPDLTEKSVKFWRVGSYLIVYSPDRHPLEIVRVLHGFRDLTKVL